MLLFHNSPLSLEEENYHRCPDKFWTCAGLSSWPYEPSEESLQPDPLCYWARGSDTKRL